MFSDRQNSIHNFLFLAFFVVAVDAKSTHLLSEINLNKLTKKQKSYIKIGPRLKHRTSATDAPIATFVDPKQIAGIVFQFSKLAFFWPNKFSLLYLQRYLGSKGALQVLVSGAGVGGYFEQDQM